LPLAALLKNLRSKKFNLASSEAGTAGALARIGGSQVDRVERFNQPYRDVDDRIAL
jgi:hypothetical protein